jgi:hypothetical protein
VERGKKGGGGEEKGGGKGEREEKVEVGGSGWVSVRGSGRG